MANLFGILSWSSTSLQAQTARTATANHNIANANTEGYSRQRAELEATRPAEMQGANYLGRGAGLQAISQARDVLAERQLSQVLGASARSDAQARGLSGLSSLDPDGGAGLVNALDGFYSALRQLGQTPGDLGSRQATVAAAQKAALAFNRASQGVTGQRSAIDVDVAAKATRVTGLAASLATLNRQVRIDSAAGGSPNDLLDARQQVQDELVALTGASVVPDSDGNVNLVLSGGALVSGNVAATLSTQSDPTNGGHLALMLTPVDGSPAGTLGSLGGTIGGLLDARDGALLTAQTSLDTLAFDWATAVNTQHRAGFGLDNVGNRDLFSLTATASGAAGSLLVQAAVRADPRQLAAASAANAPGDASNLFAIVQTESTALSSGQDIFDGIAAAIAGYGSAVETARTSSARDGAVKGQLLSLRESTSGVSMDEELVALTTAQRGYEAIMKVLKTTDEMLQTLMDLKK